MKFLPAEGETRVHMPQSKLTKKNGTKVDAHVPEAGTTTENRYFSRAVGKALEMLEILSGSSEALSLTDLSNRTRLTRSSAFRLLQTLEALHYLRRDEEGHYLPRSERAGVVSAQQQSKLINAAREPMRQLNMDYGETVSLAMLMLNHVEVVHVVESDNLIRMTNIVGRILPPYASSMGKMITAHQDPETRKRLLQSYGLTRFNENTIADERALEDEFRRIRERGYSTDSEETTVGGSCFGVAIQSATGKVEAALSLSMPTSRMPTDQANLKKMLDRLQVIAAKIAEQLRQ